MRALGDLPSQVKLAIYQLIAFEDRSKAELVFPSKEIAQQLDGARCNAARSACSSASAARCIRTSWSVSKRSRSVARNCCSVDAPVCTLHVPVSELVPVTTIP